MQKKQLKSEKGLTLVKLVLIIIILMLLAGVSTYVAIINNLKPTTNPRQEVSNNITNQVEEVNM